MVNKPILPVNCRQRRYDLHMHNASTYTGDLQVNSRCMPVIASIAGNSFHFGGGKSAVMRFEKML